MTLRSTLSVLVLACSSLAAVGCAVESTSDPSASTSDQVMLEGSVGQGSVTTKSFGGVESAGGSLRVTAREVHVRGAQGRSIDVAVAPDGSFRLGVMRGKRWLVTIDDASGSSAIVTFGGGQNILRVSADGGASRVDIGGLQLVGGEAKSSIALDARLGIEATVAGLEDVFEDARGAVIAAHEAAAEARQAAEAARATAEDARDSAEAARQAAEAARAAAGH